jgi:DNA-binding transcriptional MerR regulator
MNELGATEVNMGTILTVSEAARELERSEKWLRNAEARGKIPRAKRDLNNWRVYTPEDITKLRELIVGGVNPTEAP